MSSESLTSAHELLTTLRGRISKWAAPGRVPLVVAYVLAVLLPICVLFLRLHMGFVVGDRPALILHLIPIIVTAFLGGIGPGLVSTAMAAALSDYFLMPPIHSFSIERPIDRVQWPAMVIGGILISVLVEALHRARRKAVEREEIYGSIVNQAADSIVLVDIDTQYFVEFNDASCNNLGYSRKEFAALKLQDVETVGKLNEISASLSEALDKGGASYEAKFRSKSGEIREMWVSAKPIKIRKKAFVAAVWRDITERRKVEEILREQEQKYRLLADNTLDVIWQLDLDLRFTYVNQAVLRITGYTVDEWVGSRLSEYCDERNFARMTKIVADEIAKGPSGSGIIFEARMIRKTGEPFDVEIHGKILFDDGRPIALQGVTRDITDRKRAEAALRTSEAQLANAVEMARLGHWELDVLKREFTFNDQFYKLFRTTAEQVGGYKMALEEYARRFVHPEEISVVGDENRKALETDDPCFSRELEHRIVYADGDIGHISVRFFIVKDEQGRTVRTYGVNQDITERKKAEEALHYNEMLLREMGRMARIGGWELDPVTGRGSWTEEVARIHDLDPAEETCLEKGLSFYQGESRLKIEQALKDCVKSGKPYDLELELMSAKGVLKWVRTIGSPVTEDDKIVRLRGALQDITDRKKAEEALAESELLYRTLFENARDAIIMMDMEGDAIGRIVSANPVAAKMHGYSLDEFKALKLDDLETSESAKGLQARINAALSGELVRGEVTHRRKDGTVFPLEVSANLVEIRGRKYCIGIDRDISERKLSEETIAAERSKFKSILDHMVDGVYIVNSQHEIEYVNPALVFELGEVAGRKCYEYLVGGADPCPWCRNQEVLAGNSISWERTADATGKTYDVFETPIKNQDGSISILLILHDITERKRLEAQFLQAQKMEAIGTLAGGVAHDFNNILQVALGFSEIMLEDDEFPEPYRADLRKIRDSARRGSDLVQRLLTFSRKTEINPKPLDLNERITDLRKMLQRTLPKMVDIQLLLDVNVARISADKTQVDQILMNLAINARDAMPDGGKLIFETANIVLDEGYARTHVEAKAGPHVLLTVTDTGSGMDEDTLDHVFEPFYTTKGVGEGTGLGLAMVHGIVKHHGGHINCHSEPGKGTTFKVYFPALISEEEVAHTTEKTMPRGGTETILLVDDEGHIRDLGSRFLAKAGYTVIAAVNGREALDIYQQQSGEIDLILLDLMMPEMGGKQCLEGLLSLNPSVKVIIASGYSASGPTKEALEAGAKGFVNKPYDMRQVREVVRQVLDAE